jgi:Putative zinc-finger
MAVGGSSGAGGPDRGDADDRHVIDQLSAYLEGDLKPHTAELVGLHLARCAACGRAADQMRAIIAGARALDRPEPPPTLWPAIAGALAERDAPFLAWRRFFVGGVAVGGLAGAAVVVLIVLGLKTSGHLDWSRRSFPSSNPSSDPSSNPLPGGGDRGGTDRRASGAIVASAAGDRAQLDPVLQEAETELELAAASYEHSIAKLRSLLARMEEPRWSPDARSRFLESLARIDEAIERSRAMARSTPGDSAGNEILFAAYRSKIDFLAAAVHRGGPEEMFREAMP